MPCIMFTILISSTLCMSFFFMKHPVSMMITILIQTIMICLMIGLTLNTWWFSYMLFMIMIGGLLVLFMYMTNVASNEIFSFKNYKLISLLMPTSLYIFLMYAKKEKFLYYTQISNWMNINSMSMETMIMKFFNHPSNLILIMMMIYLLISMIMTVKITDFKKGTLRVKY